MIINRVILFLWGIFVLPLFATSQTVYRSEYFAVLPFWESPYQPFKGAVPITEDEAGRRIHLQLDYDEYNRVVQAHVKIGQYYKEFEGFFGNLNINAPKTIIEYGNKYEVHHFFDRFGNQIQIWGNVHEKVFEKDSLGRNVKLTFLDANGAWVGDLFGYFSYEWFHSEDGSIIEVRKNKEGAIAPLRGDFQFLRTKMVFGKEGYFSLLHNVDDAGNLINAECGASTLKYFYDHQGRFLKWEVYDKDGNRAIGPSNTAGEQNTFYEYDLEDIIFFNTQNNPALHWSGAERWHFEVDQYGNRTSLNYQKNDQTLMNANGGYAQIIYEWSKDGRFLLGQWYLDENLIPVNHPSSGIAKTVYQRNEMGVITKTLNYQFDGARYKIKE